MPEKQHLQPAGLFDASVYGYTQVVTSPPGTLVFIAGQVGWDSTGKVVSNDLADQTKQALANLDIALKAVGAGRADITQIRLYIPNYDVGKIRVVAPLYSAYFATLNPPAQTLLGVQALGMPELLIEIEAIAVVTE